MHTRKGERGSSVHVVTGLNAHSTLNRVLIEDSVQGRVSRYNTGHSYFLVLCRERAVALSSPGPEQPPRYRVLQNSCQGSSSGPRGMEFCS